MDYFFSAFETTRSKVKDTVLCPVVPGQYLICTDSGDVFYDTENGVRKHLTDIIDLEADADRTAILTPLDKMYFVKETAHFWRYLNGMWVNVSVKSTGRSYAKTFSTSDWANGKLTIPASEHKLNLENGCAGSNVFAIVDGGYTSQVFAAMDTDVNVDANKNVILSTPGAGYTGRVVLYS